MVNYKCRGKDMSAIQDTIEIVGISPLCHEASLGAPLRAHITAERSNINGYTLPLMNSIHPEQRADDEACQRYWDFYEKLGVLINTPTQTQCGRS